ncbi:beta-1,3-galactosyltransferase 6 [Phymastichus coffea]|uniref:beta-1,3-galactosyltransferase 6 n=1 Tax=Phymastichus coffea TaxID=108790 RepID=UPI00273C6688|nr:beta-1,3-galactosyltransferase 6 [Phymastichus coffea]
MPKIKLNLYSLLGVFLLTIIIVHYLTAMQCPSSNGFVNKQKYQLISLVLSAPDNIDQRDTIRKTWMTLTQNDVKHLFAVGLMSATLEQKQDLALENKKNNDLLLLPKLHDAYMTITKKVLQSLVYIYETYEFDFLLKVDDDSFVLVDRILKELIQWQNKGTRQELYWGYFNGKARVKRSGPWKETEWFLCDYYLPYALGGGYILSYNLVKFIAENADFLKLYNSEDVSVGLWVAPLSNIERKHDTRFDTEYRSRGCSNQYLVTHKQNTQDMKKLYEFYSRTGNLCAQEISTYLGYQYNWTAPPSLCCDRRPGIP